MLLAVRPFDRLRANVFFVMASLVDVCFEVVSEGGLGGSVGRGS